VYYRRIAARYGYSAQIYRTWVVGGRARLPEYQTHLRYGQDYSDENLQLVRAVRPRLLARYRDLPEEDLLTRSILLVLDKPAAGDQAERPGHAIDRRSARTNAASPSNTPGQ
jgi:hypothetical protein